MSFLLRLSSKSLPMKKERRTLSGSSAKPSLTNSDKYSFGPMPGMPMLINSTSCPLCLRFCSINVK